MRSSAKRSVSLIFPLPSPRLPLQVICPLRAWITTDFARVNKEIQRLYFDRQEAQSVAPSPSSEMASMMRTKNQLKKEINRDRVNREFDRQTEVVTAEMRKMPTILARHAKIVKSYGEVLRAYHHNASSTFKVAGAQKI
ncbi:hypothetical protein L596_022748 [Steinernema carpocapsae]|uniref:BAR domain-containing protein n=2 Tax=Steinernema carpocapsae TaxID=34508 RepID=A0A4U5MMN7_STECR|nr:hypothetical protein L596_022748 [Steinernema carpocapsae]